MAQQTVERVACLTPPHPVRYEHNGGGEDVPVISRKRVSAISARFASLNPYDRRFVSESILKIEKVNDDSNGQPRRLRGFAISAKRYALYERDGDDLCVSARTRRTRFNKGHSNRLEPRTADCAIVSPEARG